jgi:hypothetical protein
MSGLGAVDRHAALREEQRILAKLDHCPAQGRVVAFAEHRDRRGFRNPHEIPIGDLRFLQRLAKPSRLSVLEPRSFQNDHAQTDLAEEADWSMFLLIAAQR